MGKLSSASWSPYGKVTTQQLRSMFRGVGKMMTDLSASAASVITRYFSPLLPEDSSAWPVVMDGNAFGVLTG